MYSGGALASNLLRGAGGGGPVLLDTLSLTNPDAETGDTTGWTQTVGTGFAVGTGAANYVHSGTYGFILSTNAASAEVRSNYMNVDVSAESDIDSGEAVVTFEPWHNDFTDTDRAWPRLEFYDDADGAGNFLGVHTGDAWLSENETWAQDSYKWPVPPGTRSVALYIHGYRVTGTELSVYFDDLGDLTIGKEGTFNETVYTVRGADTLGWTVATGSGQPPSINTWSPWSWDGIYGGSQAAYEIYKDVAVSSLSAAAQAAIAAGNATLHLHRYAWNENRDDTSRTFIECRASGSPVATAQDAAALTNWDQWLDVTADASVAIPSATDTFRINHAFGRVDGTVLDAQVAFVRVWVTW